jgi:hypothetical protein
MIEIKNILKKQAEHVMKNGEFSKELTHAQKYVSIVLTQSWCPYWANLKNNLKKLVENRKDLDIIIFKLEYDLTDYFNDFLHFKENVFKNHLIPYVRYYIEGELVAETNYVSTYGFLSKFELGQSYS